MIRRQLGVLFAVGALCLAGASAAIDVGFDPVDSTILNVGQTTTVNIVADIPAGEAIVGWGLDLSIMNPTIAQLTGFTIAAPWDPALDTPDGDLLAASAFPDGISGQGVVLATLTFQGLAQGCTGIGLSDNYPVDLTEGFAIDPMLGGGYATVNYGCGTITVLPEPGALALLAVVGLMLRRR